MDPVESLLAYEAVTVHGPDRPHLVAVEATVPTWGITAVAGPRASGTTAFLRCANATVVPDAGTVRFRDVDLREVDGERHRREVGLLTGRPVPFSGTVLQNLRLGAPDLSVEDATALLDRVDLEPELLDRDATAQREDVGQLLGIARSIAAAGEDGLSLLLADDPTAALGPDGTRAVERALERLASEGTVVVLATHDPSQVERIATYEIRLARGRVLDG